MRGSRLILFGVLALSVASGLQGRAAAERIVWDVMSAGGCVASAGSGYRMSASVGQVGVDLLTGQSHTVYSGFWNPWLLSPVGVESHYDFGMPTAYGLSQNYPNPFRAQTTVPFALPQPSRVSLEIYNLQGRVVRRVAQEAKEPGYYSVVWDGRDESGRRAGDGVYVCWMIARQADGQTFAKSKSIVLVE